MVAPDSKLQGTQLGIRGNLAKLLAAALEDSNSMYFNKGGEIREKYGMDEREVMSTWWGVLKSTVKEFRKAKNIEQANVVLEVMKKGIEPAYNFYKIDPQSIGKGLTATGLLIFYIVYTMWWGFAIFFLFDGLGLSMKKAKVKQEV